MHECVTTADEYVIEENCRFERELLAATPKEIFREAKRASGGDRVVRNTPRELLDVAREAREIGRFRAGRASAELRPGLVMARAAQMPTSWIEEGVEPPTDSCRREAESFINAVHAEFRMLPTRVACSRVGGIMVAYRDRVSGRDLDVEFDNEGDICAVVATDEKVVQSEVLESQSELAALVRSFVGN